MEEQFSRSIGLLGEENFKLFKDKMIAIFGLGGVGGTALEALARTGFEQFALCDFDKVEPSNLNRQILYTQKDIGKEKVEVAGYRLMDINPKSFVCICNHKAQEFPFEQFKFDFIVDAIDDVDGKIFLAKKAQELGVPFIMSLGMANRFDPSKVKIKKLNQTSNDPLAKKIRYMAKKEGLDLSQISVVISEELPLKDGNKLNSTMMVPSAAGLSIAKFILECIIDRK